MNKIEFKVENKTQNTEYRAFYDKTSWDLYKYDNLHFSENIEKRKEGLKLLTHLYQRKPIIKELEIKNKKWFLYTVYVNDLELLKWKLRLLYYENNGLLDSFPEDRVESRTDWDTLNELYSTLMYGISELK
jgi:hypothetical protein